MIFALRALLTNTLSFQANLFDVKKILKVSKLICSKYYQSVCKVPMNFVKIISTVKIFRYLIYVLYIIK